jgi:hypothetical protein
MADQETEINILEYSYEDANAVVDVIGFEVIVECGYCGLKHNYHIASDDYVREIGRNEFGLPCLSDVELIGTAEKEMTFKVEKFEARTFQHGKEILRYKWDEETQAGQTTIVSQSAHGVGEGSNLDNAVEILMAETNLSEREAQTVKMYEWEVPQPEIAKSLGVKTSTVREYLNRAKEKAREGQGTYNAVVDAGLLG